MLELIFITSSNEKLEHARHLCRDASVYISKQKNYGIGYIEPRIDDRHELLKQSVEDAIARFKKSVPNHDEKFFFIEDTSVIISALSQTREYPGVDIKYWMRENNFSSIDNMLRQAGNDRRVTVRSDVVLALNKTLQNKLGTNYITFTSVTSGTITKKEWKIKTQPLYPWLNDKTFNKWFIPDGSNKPLSLLSIKSADKYDFRAEAFQEMLLFLEKYNYINAQINYKQLQLFEPSVFLISGPTCAGKTTLSTYLSEKYNYYHIEASDFMYLSYHERHGINSNVNIGDFAEVALKENPSIVVNQIISNITKFKNIPVIVTGFRSPLEVENFKKKYAGTLKIKVIYVSASDKTRYKRSLERNRNDAQKTYEKFKEKDHQQENMGLSKIKEIYKSSIIRNEELIESLFAKFEKKYEYQLNENLFNFKKLPILKNINSLQNVIIRILNRSNPSIFYTTTEIAHLIRDANFERSKNKNNISRYFNQNFHPYYDIQKNLDGTACYQLSQTGKAYARLLEKLIQIAKNNIDAPVKEVLNTI
ncbi:non-canonical purine NTP pyrophosphatase [Mucilaginibacter sp.]|uniref:non-canonical purine NTP pyrophosphatase n=1 Tax=Mucilaginibacter sp. TaxID=1882438 RepID=UPI0032637BD3